MSVNVTAAAEVTAGAARLEDAQSRPLAQPLHTSYPTAKGNINKVVFSSKSQFNKIIFSNICCFLIY